LDKSFASNAQRMSEHSNSKAHTEREPLDADIWCNYMTTLVEEPDSDGDYGSGDQTKIYSNTLEWHRYYDKDTLESGALTREALRANATFPKVSEGLGKKPAGIAHVGALAGRGNNPQPTAGMLKDLKEFIYDADTWNLDEVSASSMSFMLACALSRPCP
jgi:hypothetical protein